jgi:hypothetical protein
VPKTRNIILFATAASLCVSMAALALAQENGPPPQAGAAAPAGQAPRPARPGALPPQDEAKLRVEHPELYVLPPVSHKYQPKKTEWGDPDLRGMWPVDSVGGLPLQRPAAMGDRVFLTEAELKVRDAAMERQREAPAKETKSGKLGMGNWVEETGAGGRQTDMVVDPRDGRLPALTAEGKKMEALGRSSWVRGQSFDWVTDFDSWDRCITRGFPASMLPFHYNNGVQILQSPGYVVINLEMIHDARIIPLDGRPDAPAGVSNWMGVSRGHFEGNTLVVETDHIRPGAAPLNAATIGGPVPAWNTIPMSPEAHVTERFTPIDANHITYEMTYSDPVIWTAPFTLRMDWTRNEKYKFFEYACHEGDVQVRNYIIADHVKRAKEKAAAAEKAQAAGPTPASAPVAPPAPAVAAPQQRP